MKKSNFLVAAVSALVLFAFTAGAYAVECELRPIEPSVTCDHNLPVVHWGYFCNCGSPTFTIERACCPSGRWVTIATNVTGTSYTDVSLAACLTKKYRITMNPPEGCSCTGVCQYETPCISCP